MKHSCLKLEHDLLQHDDFFLDASKLRHVLERGLGQEGGFLVPDLYDKIQKALETDGVVMVGDLTTKRDYTDVRDVVRAYADLALAPELKEPIYNVCSGRSVSGEDILSAVLKTSGADGKITVKQDPSLIRPNDPKDLFGSNGFLSVATGWQPTIQLDQTIKDFVAWKKN